MAVNPSALGVPAPTYIPYDSDDCAVMLLSVLAAVASSDTPRTALVIVTCSTSDAAALVRSCSPYQLPGLADAPTSWIGLTAVPPACSRPSTSSSLRLVSVPEAMRSLFANDSVTAGAIVSVTPGATVRSPATGYGLPAAVSVVLVHNVPCSPAVASATYGSAP
jgi:hypothetical protein